ncbi:hypothetical protein Tcan_06506 [Toxocara canis]|uniref:Uncharacterized protein n=1 Tax=Toxocara canis TaxID=6265 RepID=A0A0B2VH99_TOXCA|nr:hypothetical protein Tcan_06506 [Toxocara canis]
MNKLRLPQKRRVFPLWIEIWLSVSTILCTLDVVYTMLRPITLRGGQLGTLYELWNVYSDVDLRYADKNDVVTMATGRVMIIEIIMNIAALIMARRDSRHAVLTAFTSSAFVFWKTLIYMVMYIKPPPG